MKRLIITLSAALFSGALLASTSFAADYNIDPDHTSITFKVKHLAISTVTGRFSGVQGKFSYDPASVKSASAEATIEVGSIDTHQTKRDEHLKSDDFFSAAKFPAMLFKSKQVTPGEGNAFSVLGDLTIRGVTKPVVLNAEFGGAAKDPWGNERAAFTASAKLNRQDFGLSWNKLLETGGLVVGDDVTIELEVEGIKAKA